MAVYGTAKVNRTCQPREKRKMTYRINAPFNSVKGQMGKAVATMDHIRDMLQYPHGVCRGEPTLSLEEMFDVVALLKAAERILQEDQKRTS